MVFSIAAAILFLMICEGTGTWILGTLHIEKHDYAAPAGAAVIFSLFEVLFFPVMILNSPPGVIRVIGYIVLVLAGALTLLEVRKLSRMMLKLDNLYVLAVLALYAFLWIRYHDVFASQLIKDAAGITEIMNKGTAYFNVLQGYRLFESFVCWLLNGNARNTQLMLCLSATGIASMLSMNIVNSFRLKNPWFRFTLISCALFYTEFYLWRIVGAHLGSNWRIIFTAMLLFTAYSWMKEDNEQIKYMFLFIIGAGLACHSGFLIISIEILYCFAVYLFRIQKIRSLFDITTFAIPVVIYLSGLLMQRSPAGGILLLVLYTLFILIRYKRRVYTAIIDAEYFFIDHNRVIFYIVIPSVFLIGSLILRFLIPGRGVEYGLYLNYLVSSPVSNMIFLSRNVIDYMLDVFRIAGAVVFVMKAGGIREDRMIRTMLICMVIFFVNPLCMGMLTSIAGRELYACGFEIIFNPFTDILLFVWIYQMCQWTVVGQWILELCLIGSALFGHIGSYAGLAQGLYPELVSPPENAAEVQP